MANLESWQRLLLAGLTLLLLVTLPACACADALEQLINELIAELERAIIEWWNNFIADLQRQIIDWWNKLIEDAERQFKDWWEDLQQNWHDFWLPFHPPAPSITAPTDGLISQGAAINVQGTGLAGSTLTLMRNGRVYRDVTVNEVGEWQMDGVMLNKGENTFTATVSKILFIDSPASNPVQVVFSGGELGSVPVMLPAIDPNLDPPVWMVELALEQLKANGQMFYEERRAAFTTALRTGLQASQDDDDAHRFINLDVPLTFDRHLLVFLVPKDVPTDEILEAFGKAVESAVLDNAVRQELMVQITESFERMDLTWVLEEGDESLSFEYVRIELDRAYLLEHFDPRTLAKFRMRLATELVTGLVSEFTGDLAEKVVQMSFALWGQADADSQTQHYYDLAVRAWNHRDVDGTPLPWDDPNNNAFDGDMGYTFGTNEEWAMFYLGRATFYLQSPVDPYHTIPYYKAEADRWAFRAHKIAYYMAQKMIAKDLEAVFGKVLGGARPITQIFITKEILEWMTAFLRYVDGREVQDVHRPNFAEFTAGNCFDYSMPEERQKAGAVNERAGYPFRSPNDFMLHDYLDILPFSLSERREHPETAFNIQPLLEARSQELGTNLWDRQDLRQIVRNVGQRATQYVHPGRMGQTDKRIPEGDMIVDNPYLIREVYSLQFLNRPPLGPWWQVEADEHLRLVLLDGTVIEARVDSHPLAQPVDYLYHNSQTLIENEVWVYTIILNELSYIAGSMDSFPYQTLTLVTVEGDEKHLYAVFDRIGGSPLEIQPASWPDLMYYLVGMAGNSGPAGDLPEKDGAARIATDRLVVGTLITQQLLSRFVVEVSAYQPPEPIVVGPDDLGVVFGSPGQLHLYDRHGRHVGLDESGNVDVGIPGAHYFTNPETEQQFIVIPHADLDEAYSIQVEGSGTGTFNLDLFYTDPSRHQSIRLTYDNVPISPSTIAELAVQLGDSHPLRVDQDDNGSIDQELPPSRIIEVEVVEFGQTLELPQVGVIGTLLLVLALGGIGWVVIRRRRRRQPAPVPVAPPPLICNQCGVAQRPGARFCSNCGGTLAATTPALPVCPHCGATAQRLDARFCPRCGRPM